MIIDFNLLLFLNYLQVFWVQRARHTPSSHRHSAKEAAELVNVIRPAVAIPVHFGGIVGSSSDAETFAKLVDPEIEVENIKLY